MNHPLEGIWSNCSSEDRLSRIQSLCSVACLLLVNVENPFGANYQDASGIFSIFNLIQYYRDRSPDLILTTPSFQQVQNSNNQFSSHFSWQGNVQVAGGNTAETVPYSIFGTVLLQYGAGYMLDRIEFTAYEVQLRKRPSRTLASSGGLRKKRQAFEPHAGEADPDVTTRSAGGTGRWTYSHSMGPTVPSVGSAINNPGAQNQETPTALSRSTGLPSIPITGYALTEEVFYHSGEKYHRLVLAELPFQLGGRRLDVGAGIRISSDAEPPIYLLRKEFFSVRHQYQIEGMSPVIDHLTHDSVCIDGMEYVVVLHENPSYEYCLAVTNSVDLRASYTFQVNARSLVLEVDSLCAAWCGHTAPGEYCGFCHKSQSFEVSLERFVGGGRPLWEGGCGGVWAGYFRDRNGHNVYDFSTTGNAEPVVVKRLLHVGRCAPPSFAATSTADAAAATRSGAPPRVGPAQIGILRSNHDRSKAYRVASLTFKHFHMASEGTPITSADLADGFAMKEKAGSKENPMREVELMAHIAQVIPNHADFFSTLRGFGMSENDLFVLTKELDGPSLYRIKEAGRTKHFSEGTSKEIIRRLLRALQLLHAHRIAHWDIKIENTAFRIKPELSGSVEHSLLFKKIRAPAETMSKDPLTESDLSMLDAMLIDFGQAVWDLPIAVAQSTVESVVEADKLNATSDELPRLSSSSAPSGSGFLSTTSIKPPLTALWLREMPAGRSPPGNAHSMAPEHSDFLREERQAQTNRGPGHTGPALPARSFRPEKIDMWQVGVMLFGLLTDRALFTEATREKYFTDVRSEPHWQRVNINQRMAMVGVSVTEECKDFLLKLLHVEPSVRMSVETALQHPWLQ